MFVFCGDSKSWEQWEVLSVYLFLPKNYGSWCQTLLKLLKFLIWKTVWMSMVFLGVWGLLWAIWKRPMKSQEITRKPTTNSANIWHISANPRKTGNGQVQIFQVWRWPHLVMSRCNMAKENWNSWNHWKAETLEFFQENESPAGNVKANLYCARFGLQLIASLFAANSLDLHAKSILDNPLTRSFLAWCNFQVTSREFPKLGVLFIKFRYSQMYSEGHTKYCIICSDNEQSTVFSSDCQDAFKIFIYTDLAPDRNKSMPPTPEHGLGRPGCHIEIFQKNLWQERKFAAKPFPRPD